MWKIAVVDDEANELEQTKTLIEEYLRGRKVRQYSIDTFSAPKELLNHISAANRADIYILDIVMPELSGIELGAQIKRVHPEAKIIFLTTSEEYGVASYDVQAVDYLLKPCTPARLQKAMDRVLDAKQREGRSRFFVKVPDGVYALAQRDILYVEYYDHRLIVHTAGGGLVESITQREPLATLAEPLLKEKNFLRISASFVINMDYIIKLTKSEFEMTDGSKLSISRTYSDSRSAYLDYVLEHN